MCIRDSIKDGVAVTRFMHWAKTHAKEGYTEMRAAEMCIRDRCKMYMKNFGEFFNDQVEHANAIILSRTGEISPDKLNTCLLYTSPIVYL